MAAAEARGGEFPVGMKVLVVDDDPTCLVVLKRMLLECRYDGEQLPRSSPTLVRLLCRASAFTGREAIDCFPVPIG
jgi:two-component response regulator ARR-B family